jgi:hypothetical protein
MCLDEFKAVGVALVFAVLGYSYYVLSHKHKHSGASGMLLGNSTSAAPMNDELSCRDDLPQSPENVQYVYSRGKFHLTFARNAERTSGLRSRSISSSLPYQIVDTQVVYQSQVVYML